MWALSAAALLDPVPAPLGLLRQNLPQKVADTTIAALCWLGSKEHPFIFWEDASRSYQPTPFGRAVLASGLPPQQCLLLKASAAAVAGCAGGARLLGGLNVREGPLAPLCGTACCHDYHWAASAAPVPLAALPSSLRPASAAPCPDAFFLIPHTLLLAAPAPRLAALAPPFSPASSSTRLWRPLPHLHPPASPRWQEDLARARQSFVMTTELHLTYLCVPLNDLVASLDWKKFDVMLNSLTVRWPGAVGRRAGLAWHGALAVAWHVTLAARLPGWRGGGSGGALSPTSSCCAVFCQCGRDVVKLTLKCRVCPIGIGCRVLRPPWPPRLEWTAASP